MPTSIRRAVLAPAAVLCGALVLACAGAGAPPASGGSPPSTPPRSTAPIDSPPVVSGPGGASGSDPGIGGGEPGNPGSGSGIGLPSGPAPVDPGAGRPTFVIAKPGRLDPHPVPPIALASSLDGRLVRVQVTWYSGVEPCSVLDSVLIARSGHTIELTVIEGADAMDVACREIAMLKATIVDLGDLDPGTWSIRPTSGDAAPIEVTIT